MLIHQYGPRSLSERNQVRHKSGGVSPGAAAFLGGVAFGCVSFVLPQRFAAAFLAISTRRSGGIRSARARPPLRPSSWVSASPGSAMFSSNTPGAPELSAELAERDSITRRYVRRLRATLDRVCPEQGLGSFR